jgi:hypothetical protein
MRDMIFMHRVKCSIWYDMRVRTFAFYDKVLASVEIASLGKGAATCILASS